MRLVCSLSVLRAVIFVDFKQERRKGQKHPSVTEKEPWRDEQNFEVLVAVGVLRQSMEVFDDMTSFCLSFLQNSQKRGNGRLEGFLTSKELFTAVS